jgi:Holliday junction resolvase
MSSAAQRARCLARIQKEQGEAAKLCAAGYTVYSPTVVCDRIAVRDGRVWFVEFKKGRQKLRPGQQAIHDLMPEHYLIVRHE